MNAGSSRERVEPSFAAVPMQEDETLRFAFTGSGREYFRIWLVNLCLTIATLGIYSAWAKVRRLQYFSRNTRLGDAVFDFHGDPKSILKGRLVAVGLLGAYHYAFGFSRVFGAAVVCFLLVALPWLMRSALRFRLRNTSYRGLRFGFDGSVKDAYLAYGPMMLVFFAPTALAAMNPSNPGLAGAAGLLYIALPWLHARIKAYQHAGLHYGSAHASYAPQTKKIISAYWRVSWVSTIITAAAGVILGVGVAALGAKVAGGGSWAWPAAVAVFGMAMAGYVLYLVAGPWLQATVANLLWSNTAFPEVRIRSEISPRGYVKLQAVNTLLVLLTFGLYRPFAVVSACRYRLNAVTLQGEFAFERIAAGRQGGKPGTAGDSAADFFGFDLSW